MQVGVPEKVGNLARGREEGFQPKLVPLYGEYFGGF
jgi:hypothetical protein